jgi:uncharacterized protein DUF3175
MSIEGVGEGRGEIMRSLSTASLNVYHGKEHIKTSSLVRRGDKAEQCAHLEPGVFTWKDPRKIAESFKRSAEESMRRKGTPLQSAMSMLNFYINRAGKHLDASQRDVLKHAKREPKPSTVGELDANGCRAATPNRDQPYFRGEHERTKQLIIT